MRKARAQRILRRWEEAVGKGLASKSWPDRYERGTVWVAVQGSAWAQELRMIKDRILEKLSEMAGEPGLFVDVRFGVRPLAPEPEIAELADPAIEEEHRQQLQNLSIREIAERRRKLS